MCEGLLFAHAAGLDVDAWLGAVRGGAAGSRSLELYAPKLRSRDFNPGFYVKHFIKDLGLCLDECASMKLALPGLSLAAQLYASLDAFGDGESGTHALLLTLERLNNRVVPAAAAAASP